ncbi:NAD(P)H-dependent oxidoreductase [Aeromonas veronii]
MSKVVVISGHPNLDNSYTNAVIIDKLMEKISDVEVRRLDVLYPDYNIDVNAEQQALMSADIVVLQFPFYWYSTPAIMKKWIDDIFTFNFAYGPEGDKLEGKDFILSFTIGGPEQSYDPLGYNHFTIEQFIKPLQQLAYLAKMNYRLPVYTHRMIYIPDIYNKLDEVQARAIDHSERLISQILSLQNDPDILLTKFSTKWFEKMDLLPESSEFFIKYIDDDFEMHMPEGDFNGVEGFNNWYEQARSTFKSPCQHILEQISVNKSDDQFKVELRVRVIAETYPESSFKGTSINILMNESWNLTVNSNNEIRLHDYKVVAA